MADLLPELINEANAAVNVFFQKKKLMEKLEFKDSNRSNGVTAFISIKERL